MLCCVNLWHGKKKKKNEIMIIKKLHYELMHQREQSSALAFAFDHLIRTKVEKLTSANSKVHGYSWHRTKQLIITAVLKHHLCPNFLLQSYSSSIVSCNTMEFSHWP